MHYIDFPNLGIHLEMNPELFKVGPFTVHWYGIITAVAFLAIILGTLRNSEKYGLSKDDLIDMMLITTPVGIIGARIFYVVVNWEYYAGNLSEIYKIWHGGLAIYGGIIVGIITIYLFCRFRKISTLKLLDHIVVYLVLGQVIGRWGNFVNQELFGPNTNLPWGMTGDIIKNTIAVEQYPGVSPELPVHPLFLYESLWNLLAFFVLLWFRKRKKLEGEVFSLYMIFYGMARFLIDSLRFDLMVGGFNVNRIIGILFALAFAVVFIVRRVRLGRQAGEEAYQPSQYRHIIDTIMEDNPEGESSANSEGKAAAVDGSSDTDSGETGQEAGTKPDSDKSESIDEIESKTIDINDENTVTDDGTSRIEPEKADEADNGEDVNGSASEQADEADNGEDVNGNASEQDDEADSEKDVSSDGPEQAD